MLVIALKLDEKVLIGDKIDIQVTSIQRGIIRLAIDAPKDIRIQRVPRKIEIKSEDLNNDLY